MSSVTSEHYKILQIPTDATLVEIKKAYRKRAFELHPDLNPTNKNAQRDFQLLNEAYITLIDYHNTLKESEANKKKQAHASYAKNATGAQQSTNKQSQNTQNSSKQEKQNTQSSSQNSQQKTKEQSHEQRKEHVKTEKHKRTYNHSNGNKKRKAESAYKHESAKADSKVFNNTHEQEENDNDNFSYNSRKLTREEVVQDILNDPFARRVYEDIYRNIGEQQEEAEKKGQKKIFVDWGARYNSYKSESGITGFIKSWLRKQIDETLQFRFPITSLYPGSRIRLKIAQGLSNETRKVDITLPRDFIIGKPVRLTGLGKKLGAWQGDLYIILLPILPKE